MHLTRSLVPPLKMSSRSKEIPLTPSWFDAMVRTMEATTVSLNSTDRISCWHCSSPWASTRCRNSLPRHRSTSKLNKSDIHIGVWAWSNDFRARGSLCCACGTSRRRGILSWIVTCCWTTICIVFFPLLYPSNFQFKFFTHVCKGYLLHSCNGFEARWGFSQVYDFTVFRLSGLGYFLH